MTAWTGAPQEVGETWQGGVMKTALVPAVRVPVTGAHGRCGDREVPRGGASLPAVRSHTVPHALRLQRVGGGKGDVTPSCLSPRRGAGRS
jgi:hypothetical protein